MFLYLLRHGQSLGTTMGKFHCQIDYPLTELGHQQTRQAANKPKDVSFAHCRFFNR